jgi:CRISPR-associated protein Csb1
MTARLDPDRLVAACRDESFEAGISICTELEPLGGQGDPVKPATYERGRFQHDRRWFGSGAERAVSEIIVIDNEPSQANRLEAALRSKRDQLGLPDIVLDLSAAGTLPSHLPREISIYQFPHRNADAYLRDAELDGAPFRKTEVGEAIFSATARHADALLSWCPQALLFGFWQSHLGKKRSQSKQARSWVSEIIGIDPAVGETEVPRLGLKGDPLNLSVDEAVVFDEDLDMADWILGDKSAAKDRGKKSDRLSKIGHGQVPIGDSGGDSAAPCGVSFRTVVQQATVSFASVRTVRTMTGSAEARAVLVSLGLVAHVAEFGRAFHLRSGADLRPHSTSWRWLGADGDENLDVPDLEAASALLRDCAALAEATGLEVGSHWPAHRLVLQPSASLLNAINKSWPVA